MNFDATTVLGFAAAAMTTAAFLPQAIKTWRTRQTRDISLGMFSVLCLGICLWLAYGFLRDDLPLIIANAITLVLAGTILVLKLKYK
jgi:MtN3 and saliva related transmembrane protein